MAYITVRRSVASVLYLSLAAVCLVGVNPAAATTGREAVGMVAEACWTERTFLVPRLVSEQLDRTRPIGRYTR